MRKLMETARREQALAATPILVQMQKAADVDGHDRPASRVENRHSSTPGLRCP
jgi:hypothetical protein